ncbi:YbjN domain-containing protein [Ruminococcus sp.]|uniref:YbjN domain-containing protein n=1 Tax=Ruminococcus sp. TaxID=41978 RepID=UPI0025FEA988|nr:YbjN domain-containing protein [Ruminococcus sp.]
MEQTKNEMNSVVADFCALLESRKVTYERNQQDENMIRFRTKLPNHDTAPFILIHFNPQNSALSLAISRLALFSSVSEDLYKLMNDFNSDPANFACKMFTDKEGQIIVLTNAILRGEDTSAQIEEYINISVLATDKYFGKISELIGSSNNN